jgi:hypothetical protein
LQTFYNQNDELVMTHLNLSLLVYWIVNTIRYN